MAISGFQISYSQFTRYYNLFEFLTGLSFLFFILSLRKKTIYFFLNSIASCLDAFFAIFMWVFLLSAQFLFLCELAENKKFNMK